MQLTIPQPDLAALLDAVAGATGKVQPCDSVHLRAVDGVLTATTTDYDIAARAWAPCNVEASGAAYLPHKLLAQIAAAQPAESVLSLRDDDAPYSLVIATGRSRYTVQGLDPGMAADGGFDEPDASAVQVQLPAVTLRHALASVAACISHDESRPALCGVYLRTVCDGEGDKLLAATTDGHRLAECTVALDLEVPSGAWLLPGAVVRELAKVLAKAAPGDVAQALAGRAIVFGHGRTSLRCRPVAEAFPDYRRVIPDAGRDDGDRLDAGRLQLLASLKRIGPTLGPSRMVTLVIGAGGVTLEAETEGAQGVDEVRDDLFRTLAPARLGLDASYLREALSVFTCDRVTIDHAGAFAPVLLTAADNPGLRLVLMPMKLDSPR